MTPGPVSMSLIAAYIPAGQTKYIWPHPEPWGRVDESNENNNIYGPVVVHVTGATDSSVNAIHAPMPSVPTRQEPH